MTFSTPLAAPVQYVDLPLAEIEEGSRLYGVEFSDSGIKVGRTGDVRTRLLAHASVANRRGVHVVNAWITTPVGVGADGLEAALVSALAGESTSRTGREWFYGVTLDRAAVVAGELVTSWTGRDVAALPGEERFVLAVREALAARRRKIAWLALEIGMRHTTLSMQLARPRTLRLVTALRVSEVLDLDPWAFA